MNRAKIKSGSINSHTTVVSIRVNKYIPDRFITQLSIDVVLLLCMRLAIELMVGVGVGVAFRDRVRNRLSYYN